MTPPTPQQIAARFKEIEAFYGGYLKADLLKVRDETAAELGVSQAEVNAALADDFAGTLGAG